VTLRSLALRGAIVYAMAGGLVGCASPGPGSYAAASSYHQRAAQQDWASGQPNAAQWEHFQANKDAWLSRLGW
jgi:hypothetical protein